MPTLKLLVKYGYQKLYYYPLNDIAERFVKLAKQKSLSESDMKIIASLGYIFELEYNDEQAHLTHFSRNH